MPIQTEAIVGHTPGRWFYNGRRVTTGAVIVADIWNADEPEGQANARLISAAPDLYEALKGWLPIAEQQLDRLPEESRISAAYGFARERIGRSQAAIDKAEGEGNVVATQIVGDANARLFQAAPEMYELIRDLWRGWHTAARNQFEDRIVALLNKVEGRTS